VLACVVEASPRLVWPGLGKELKAKLS